MQKKKVSQCVIVITYTRNRGNNIQFKMGDAKTVQM